MTRGRGGAYALIDPSVQDRDTQDRLHRLCRRYIRVAFFYLVLGLLLGAGMLVFGNDNFLFVHTHVLLIGFVAEAGGPRGDVRERDPGGYGDNGQ